MTKTTKPVALVIGASRGIGRQIAIDLAQAGYAVVVAAKSQSSSPSPSLSPFPPEPNSRSSTINTVEHEIRSAGGEAVAIAVDVTDSSSVNHLLDQTISRFNALDVLIYNPGAIWWASVDDTPLKRYQLMHRVNSEGLYAAVQAALPHLTLSKKGGRIIVVSPPIYSRFFRGKTAYAMTKVAMSVLTKGLAMDFERQGMRDMAITSIWPAVVSFAFLTGILWSVMLMNRKSIESAATEQFTLRDPAFARDLRKPTIFSDAILAMLNTPASVVNGQLELDEDFLRRYAGVDDFSKYSVVPGSSPRRIMPALLPDLTIPEQDDEGMRHDSAKERRTKL